MKAALRDAIVRLLSQALQALAPAPASLDSSRLQALSRFLSLMPASELVALATGSGTLDNALDVAAAAAELVARAFPPAAITAEEVKLGLEALQFLIDAAGLGPLGVKPGYRPVKDAYAGARGHI